ncbi:MAG TPA: hypothetical protein VGI55_02280 [Solirubrobacteraceae bacterium]
MQQVFRKRLAVVSCLGITSIAFAGCGASSSPASPPITAQANGSPTDTQTSTDPATTAAGAASTTTAHRLGPEGIPLEKGRQLAPASTTTQGATVDGIQCAPLEQLAYHIHTHLQVYVKGKPWTLPAAIGLVGPVAQQTPYGPFYGAQKCYYWLHTHATDGIIHIESPTARIYTLGDFFDEWRQPLSSRRVASATGAVHATVNGRPWTRSPRAILLRKHTVIQLAVGRPIPPFHKVNWGTSGL